MKKTIQLLVAFLMLQMVLQAQTMLNPKWGYNVGTNTGGGKRINVLLEDNFNSTGIDYNKWDIENSSPNDVKVENGIMKLEQNVTDKMTELVSKWITIDPNKKIIIKRKVYLHTTKNCFNGKSCYFYSPSIMLRFNYNKVDNIGVSYNYSHYVNNKYVGDADCEFGFYLAVLGKKYYKPFKIPNQGLILDNWFEEKIEFEPITGLMNYYINGTFKGSWNSNFRINNSASTTVQLRFNPYGWWTTHYQYFDDLKVYQIYDAKKEVDNFKNEEFQIFPDLPKTEMVFVQGGTFTMGCTDEQGSDCEKEEKPAHQVKLSDYYIGKYEVTQGLWKKVMGKNPSYFKYCGDDCPVENVSWNDCQAFINKLNQLTSKRFRLPTEAEWEYAARGGRDVARNVLAGNVQQTKYAGSNALDEVAWYGGNRDGKTHTVGTKKPNALGVYDMSGNVWEWCNDWYGAYSNKAVTNPQGAKSGFGRVVRGGSWSNSGYYNRVSDRDDFISSYRDFNSGLRLTFSSY